MKAVPAFVLMLAVLTHFMSFELAFIASIVICSVSVCLKFLYVVLYFMYLVYEFSHHSLFCLTRFVVVSIIVLSAMDADFFAVGKWFSNTLQDMDLRRLLDEESRARQRFADMPGDTAPASE